MITRTTSPMDEMETWDMNYCCQPITNKFSLSQFSTSGDRSLPTINIVAYVFPIVWTTPPNKSFPPHRTSTQLGAQRILIYIENPQREAMYLDVILGNNNKKWIL